MQCSLIHFHMNVSIAFNLCAILYIHLYIDALIEAHKTLEPVSYFNSRVSSYMYKRVQYSLTVCTHIMP